MRSLLFTTLFIGGLFGPPPVPKQAAEKYAGKQYAEAARLYESAIKDYPGQRGALEFNVGQGYIHLDSTNLALMWYNRASADKLNAEVASMAWNNIGGIFASTPPHVPGSGALGQGQPAQAGDPLQGQIDQMNRALEAFKSSLKRSHENEFARYNYELVKRKLQQLQQQQQEQQQNQQNDQEKQNQQKEEKDENQQNRPQNQQKQRQNTEKNQGQQGEQEELTMEQAKMLLEAMKDNEKKFLQQLEKSKKRRNINQDGPDW